MTFVLHLPSSPSGTVEIVQQWEGYEIAGALPPVTRAEATASAWHAVMEVAWRDLSPRLRKLGYRNRGWSNGMEFPASGAGHIAREIAVLLWALPADGGADAVVTAWLKLAPEERWWLYSQGAPPREGKAWRAAIAVALRGTTMEGRERAGMSMEGACPTQRGG